MENHFYCFVNSIESVVRFLDKVLAPHVDNRRKRRNLIVEGTLHALPGFNAMNSIWKKL